MLTPWGVYQLALWNSSFCEIQWHTHRWTPSHSSNSRDCNLTCMKEWTTNNQNVNNFCMRILKTRQIIIPIKIIKSLPFSKICSILLSYLHEIKPWRAISDAQCISCHLLSDMMLNLISSMKRSWSVPPLTRLPEQTAERTNIYPFWQQPVSDGRCFTGKNLTDESTGPCLVKFSFPTYRQCIQTKC